MEANAYFNLLNSINPTLLQSSRTSDKGQSTSDRLNKNRLDGPKLLLDKWSLLEQMSTYVENERFIHSLFGVVENNLVTEMPKFSRSIPRHAWAAGSGWPWGE